MIFIVAGIGILALSCGSILIKLCSAPALVIAAYRMTLAAGFFIPLQVTRAERSAVERGARVWPQLALSGFFLALHFATWISSLKYTSVAVSVVLVTTAPIFVALGAVLILRERLPRLAVLGIFVTMCGALLMGTDGLLQGRTSLLGNSLALIGAIGYAGYLLVGRSLRPKMETITYVSGVYSLAAIFLILLALLFGLDMTGYDGRTYLLFLLIAMVPQGIGHTGFNWLLRHLNAATVSLLALGEPVGASILAFVFLGENVTLVQVGGGILILAGVALAVRGEPEPV